MFKLKSLIDFFMPRLYMDSGGGGGGSGGGTQVQELPEWAKPYAKATLEKGAALTERPYQAYGAVNPATGQFEKTNRIAGFEPLQAKAQQAAENMQTSGATGAGIGIAGEAAMRGLGTQYQAGQFQNQFQAPEAYQAGRFGARPVRAQGLQQYQMGPAQQVSAPELQQFQMGPAERVRTQSFTRPGAAEAYMSPYMQNVVDIQQREARRASDIARQGQQAQAVGQGAFGGSRQAILEAERQRNLATQLGDIQATGSQAAYNAAQQQFNAEQNARLQAQQANQQAGLTTGLQNLNALLGVQQLGAGQNLQSQLANQQAGLTTGQQNLAALLGVQSLGAQQGLQAQQLNQQAALEAQRLGEQSRQFGAGQGLQAASLGAQYGQAANQLGEQSRQFGANLGLQGLSTALQGAGQLGSLGGQQFQQGMDINKLQSAYGGQQQALRQQGLTQAYEDFQNEQNYPYKQLGFMSDLIRGLPLGQQTAKSMYEGPGNFAGQVAGLGMGAYGLSKLSNFMAEGGEVHGYADGGSVDSVSNIQSIVKSLSDQQLQQAAQAAQVRGDVDQLEVIKSELAMRASERSGMAGAFNSLPAESQEAMTQMAGGGVVAFADEGLVTDPMGTGAAEIISTPKDENAQTLFERLTNEPAWKSKLRREQAEKDSRKPEPNSPYAATSTTALDAEDAQAFADQMGKAKKGSSKGISDHPIVRQAADVAKANGIPQESFEDTFKRLYKEIGKDKEDVNKEMLAMQQKAVDRLNDMKQRAGAEALMQYGFGVAKAASRPGARFMGSISEASPIISQTLGESEKVRRAAEDNLDKIRMDQLRFNQAMNRQDFQSAAQFAGLLSQDKKFQRQLDLQEKQLGITAAYHAQQNNTAIQKIADDLQRNDPNIDRRSALNEASRIAGYSYRTDALNSKNMAEGIRKINEKYSMLAMLPPGSDMAKQMAAQKAQDIAEFKQSLGGAGMGEPSVSGSNTVMRFDSKGNLIQ